MHLRLGSLVAVLSVALLSGCVASPAPSPTLTLSSSGTAAPATLEELAKAVASEGLVESAALNLIGGSPGALQIQLFWDEPPSPAEQLDALARVDARIDTVLPDRPETTQISLAATPDDGTVTGVTTAYDPGEEVLLEMLEIASGPTCGFAALTREDLGDGPKQVVDLKCSVEAVDAAGLAAGYDEITANRIEAAGFETHWDATITGRPSTDASMRLDVGRIEGRQQLFVDVMSIATAGGADRLTVIDGVTGITIVGFATAEQAQLCATMREQLVAAGLVDSSVSLQLRDTTPEAWACRVTP
jgi:hypothetical protein